MLFTSHKSVVLINGINASGDDFSAKCSRSSQWRIESEMRLTCLHFSYLSSLSVPVCLVSPLATPFICSP